MCFLDLNAQRIIRSSLVRSLEYEIGSTYSICLSSRTTFSASIIKYTVKYKFETYSF